MSEIVPPNWCVDSWNLPTDSLPLLRDMLGRQLINMTRFCWFSPDAWESLFGVNRRALFRKDTGVLAIELANRPPIYFGPGSETFSVMVISGADEPRISYCGFTGYFYRWRVTLHDREYVDEGLYQLLGRRVTDMKILIRRAESVRWAPRPLQSGLEITFDNGTTIVLSFYLDREEDWDFFILYPEEVAWNVVIDVIDVASGQRDLRYLGRKLMWKILNCLGCWPEDLEPDGERR